VPEAEQLERLAAKGPLRIKLKPGLDRRSQADVAWNISGEIKGSEKPDEVIVIGGHLDSWDVGTGALDDATGVAITTAAAKLIGDLPKHPKRTIRVVMFGSEESGGSSEAYLAAHKDELPKIVLAGESDTGADRIYSLQIPRARPATRPCRPPCASDPAEDLCGPHPAGPCRRRHRGPGGVRRAGDRPEPGRQPLLRLPPHHGRHPGQGASRRTGPERRGLGQPSIYLVADSDIDFRALSAAAPAAPAGH
jgi:hypothetical protein